MIVRMNRAREAAIKAVVDAWTVPGVSPGYHAEWQARLAAPSEDGGWPVLARAIQQLVAVEGKRRRWR
jgi:hypothetical protein